MIERLMDAAARATGIDQVELRRRNMIRPAQMPYRNPLDKTYDSGAFAKVMDQACTLADWAGFDARREAATRQRTLARPRDGGVPRVDGCGRVRGDGDGHDRCRRRRDRLGDAGDGAGTRDDLRAARRRRVRRAHREDPDRAGRHRSRARIRQRRFALALRRRLRRARRGRADRRRGTPARGGGARSRGRRHRVLGRRVRRRRHRPSNRPLRARAARARTAHRRRLDEQGRRRNLAQRLPHLRGRGRPRHRGGRGGGLLVRQRRRPRDQSADRRGPDRGGRGARASGRRSASSSSTRRPRARR